MPSRVLSFLANQMERYSLRRSIHMMAPVEVKEAPAWCVLFCRDVENGSKSKRGLAFSHTSAPVVVKVLMLCVYLPKRDGPCENTL